jgi:hypothetical protein
MLFAVVTGVAAVQGCADDDISGSRVLCKEVAFTLQVPVMRRHETITVTAHPKASDGTEIPNKTLIWEIPTLGILRFDRARTTGTHVNTVTADGIGSGKIKAQCEGEGRSSSEVGIEVLAP